MEPAVESSISVHSWNEDRTELAMSPNTSDVIIYSASGTNLKHWKKLQILKGHKMRITSIDWSYPTDTIVTSSNDGTIYIWRKKQNQWKSTLISLRTFHKSATCVKWSPNGRKFAVGTNGKQISICYYSGVHNTSNNGWITKYIRMADSSILSVDWSPNNMLLICGCTDFKCKIFYACINNIDNIDTKNRNIYSSCSFGDLLYVFNTANGWIECCKFSPNGLHVAFTGHDSSIHFGSFDKITHLKTQKQQKTLHTTDIIDNILQHFTDNDDNKQCSERINIQSINRKTLPLKCIEFLSDTILIGAGYDCVPILYKYNKTDSKWVENGPIDTGLISKQK
eukprot:137529_1